jgi:phosphotransferase system enzyme I (PtsI)
MVEVPSVALSIDNFLHKVDFVNIGTNDLIQYTFAADRNQTNVARYNRFSHPISLRLIRNVVNAADRQGKEIVACGAMASHPRGICLLIGMGVRSFSLQADKAAAIRNVVSRVNSNDLEAIVNDLENCTYAHEIEAKFNRSTYE